MSFQGQPTGIQTGTVAAASMAKFFAIVGDGANGNNNVKLAGAGEKVEGVTLNETANAGEGVAYATGGNVWLTVDGNAAAIAAGDWLKADGSGQGVKTTTDTEVVFAKAREASTTAGEVIKCRIFPAFTLST